MTNTADLHDGTGSGLIHFIEYMSSKGLMKSNTAAAYRSAASKVLKIDGDGWEAVDIRQLDIDEQIVRFETLSGANYTPSSLATYKTRFGRVVEMYLDYLKSPSSFKPQVQVRRTRPKPSPKDGANGETLEEEAANAPAPSRAPELIEYPFPLTTGENAYLRLPRSISSTDVERLASFIRSVSIDPDTSSTSGKA